MTNHVAMGLVLALLAFVALDHWLLHWGAPLFAARAGVELIEWVAFWR